MSTLRSFAASLTLLGLLAVFLFGCGGGGGGSSVKYSNPRIEAIIPGTSTPANLSSVSVNTTVHLQILADSSAGGTVELQATGWRTSADPSVAVVSNSGDLSALQISAAPFTVSVNFQGKTISANASVVAPNATVSGRVTLADTGGSPVDGARIVFYDANGVQTASTVSDATGAFTLSGLPLSSKTFTVDFSSSFSINLAPVSVYTQFGFGRFDYRPDCMAKLPALTTNQVLVLPDPIVLYPNAGPPPPPFVCVP